MPVSQAFFVSNKDNPKFGAIISIFADTKTRAQRYDVEHAIEARKRKLAVDIALHPDLTAAKKLVYEFCAGVQRDTKVSCRGILARGFDCTQYATTSPLYKEVAER